MIEIAARNKGFLIPLSLVNRAAREGIALPELQNMVRHAARITHPEGNRRYHDYLFSIVGNRVSDFKLMTEPANDEEQVYKCEHCSDVGTVPVFDECPKCEGVGCNACDAGLVRSAIACPMCKVDAPMPFRRVRRG